MIWLQDADFTLYNGDALEALRSLPDESVDCCITSPPYWGLRDYGTGAWEGGDAECDHSAAKVKTRYDYSLASSPIQDGTRTGTDGGQYRSQCPCGATRIDNQLGLEPTPEEYVARMVEVFREVRRVLAKHGTCWLNLGDSYYTDTYSNRNNATGGLGGTEVRGGGALTHKRDAPGLKQKDLCGIPWRVAFALQADGWVLRSDVVWAKPNPMPESVTDRPTKSHEYVFLLTKAEWKGIANPLRLDRADAMWLAAMIDGEGTVCVNTRKDRQNAPTYSAAVRCYNTSRALIDRVAELAGCGTITRKPGSGEDGTRECWQWQCGGRTAVPVLDAIEPYLIAKRQQAHLVLELQGMPRHHGAQPGFGKGMKPRPAAITRRQEEISRGCSELNRTGATDVQVFAWKRGYWKPLPYSFDQEAVREPHARLWDERNIGPRNGWTTNARRDVYPGEQEHPNQGLVDSLPNPSGRNIRSVWEIATQPFPEAHFATFPEELVRRCLLAGCPEQVCGECGKARERIVEQAGFPDPEPQGDDLEYLRRTNNDADRRRVLSGQRHAEFRASNPPTFSWTDCGHAKRYKEDDERNGYYRPGIVLDPFCGSGTVALVARKHGRRCVGIELSAEYCEMIQRRTQQLSLLAVES